MLFFYGSTFQKSLFCIYFYSMTISAGTGKNLTKENSTTLEERKLPKCMLIAGSSCSSGGTDITTKQIAAEINRKCNLFEQTKSVEIF